MFREARERTVGPSSTQAAARRLASNVPTTPAGTAPLSLAVGKGEAGATAPSRTLIQNATRCVASTRPVVYTARCVYHVFFAHCHLVCILIGVGAQAACSRGPGRPAHPEILAGSPRGGARLPGVEPGSPGVEPHCKSRGAGF